MTLEDLAGEIAELRRRLDVSESVLAIQAMKARYAELVDQRFAKGEVVDATTLADLAKKIADLFTPDGTWVTLDVGDEVVKLSSKVVAWGRLRKSIIHRLQVGKFR